MLSNHLGNTALQLDCASLEVHPSSWASLLNWLCFHVAATCLPLEVRTEVSRRTAGVPTWAGLAKQCFFPLPAPARQDLGCAGICLPSRCRSHLGYFLEKGVM